MFLFKMVQVPIHLICSNKLDGFESRQRVRELLTKGSKRQQVCYPLQAVETFHFRAILRDKKVAS